MKKSLHIAMFAGALLLLALAWYGTVINRQSAPPADSNQPEQNNEPSVKPSLLLTVVQSNVQLKKASESDFSPITAPTAAVSEGDSARTSQTGRAVIESDGAATVVIDKNSEFTITSSAAAKSNIMLLLGNLWARVRRLVGQDESFTIETSNAVATVRGTSFGVLYQQGVTTLMVGEGSIALQSVDPLTRAPLGDAALVAAGQKGTVQDGKPSVVTALSAQDMRSPWYASNQPQVSDDGMPQPVPQPTPSPGAPKPPTSQTQPPIACTQEAKLCPDGSYVGRTGPNCEFAPCPQTSTPQQPQVEPAVPSVPRSQASPAGEAVAQAPADGYTAYTYEGQLQARVNAVNE